MNKKIVCFDVDEKFIIDKLALNVAIAAVIAIEFFWAPVLTIVLNLNLSLVDSSNYLFLGFFNLTGWSGPNLAINIIELLALVAGWAMFLSIYRDKRLFYKVLISVAVLAAAGLLTLQTISFSHF